MDLCIGSDSLSGKPKIVAAFFQSLTLNCNQIEKSEYEVAIKKSAGK
jgi:hypothetical protein